MKKINLSIKRYSWGLGIVVYWGIKEPLKTKDRWIIEFVFFRKWKVVSNYPI